MNFESFGTSSEGNRKTRNDATETVNLAQGFRELAESKDGGSVFEDLEHNLETKGFKLADQTALGEVFYNNSLLCRSESFSRAMDLVLKQEPITILYKRGDANMCVMGSGEGFKVAMTEGFSGKDVNGMVKVVISFKSTHLEEREPLPASHQLWEVKPDTAKLSLVGDGQILPEDIEMVSFRFPVHFFPEALLSKEEQELLENVNIRFIVRHYIPSNKKTMH